MLRARPAQVHRVLVGGVGAGRLVQEGARARDGRRPGAARRRVLLLPDPPRAVDVGVVQVERWVAGRDEEVAAWVSACAYISGVLGRVTE